MKKLLAIGLVTLTTGCSSMSSWDEYSPGLGSYGDAATTFYVLNNTNLVEANPILSGIGDPFTTAIVTIGLKHVAKMSFRGGPEIIDRSIESAGIGATAWNLAVIAGKGYATAGVGAVVAGYFYWNYRLNRAELKNE